MLQILPGSVDGGTFLDVGVFWMYLVLVILVSLVSLSLFLFVSWPPSPGLKVGVLGSFVCHLL